MKGLLKFGAMLGIALGLLLAPPSRAGARLHRRKKADNDQTRGIKPPPPLRQPKNAAPNNAKNGNGSPPAVKPGPPVRNMMGLPPAWVERLQDMSPEQQEKFLSNNQRFQGMTPQQQAQIRNRLQYWNNLTPDQRQELREREQVWEKMSPEQRLYVRDTLLPKWQAMPPASKQIIRRHLARLQGLNEDERQQMLNNPAFMRNMTPEEQNMLRELSRLRVGNTPDAPPAPGEE
jgi:hypothetical protein